METKFLSSTESGLLPYQILKTHFCCIGLSPDSPDFDRVLAKFPFLPAPLFSIVSNDSIVYVVKQSDSYDVFDSLLRKFSESAQETISINVPSSGLPYKYTYDNDLEHLRALIHADKCERISQKKATLRPKADDVFSQPRGTKCALSIRLLDGETMKGLFEPDQTLADVKRWIEREKGFVFTPEDDSSMPSFAANAGPGVIHYAFCYLGVPRVTFSEGQELSRLSDLGLCPRLALILKPVYNQNRRTRENHATFWRSVTTKIKTMATALYTFFDYGLEDAERDWNYLSDLVEEDTKPAFVIHDPAEDSKREAADEKTGEKQIATLVNGKDTPLAFGGADVHFSREVETNA